MCGRYKLNTKQKQMLEQFVGRVHIEDCRPSYNVAPSQREPECRQERDRRFRRRAAPHQNIAA
jgi:putative SOS response-associated peptidase YedK